MIKKYNKEQKISAIFANIFFVLIVLFSIFLIVYALYKIFNHTEYVSLEFYFISIMSGAVIATLFSFGIKRLSNNFKVYLSVFVLITGFVVLGFETYLELYIEEKLPTQRVAKDETSNWISTFIKEQKKDIQFDTRTKLEVINDFKDSGIDAFPNISPSGFIGFNYINGFTSKKGKIYPLGSIPNALTINANQSGYYPISMSDEHGFMNPKGLYKKDKVDIILTGGSIANSDGVNSDESITAVLRQMNLNAINITSADNGSLIKLAALKEYAEPLKPKIIIWAYSAHSLYHLSEEMKSPLLKRYLYEDNYSQKLISRQEEVKDVLLSYYNSEWINERTKKNIIPQENSIKTKKDSFTKNITKYSIIKIAKLYNLRKRINLIPAYKHPPVPSLIFKDILKKSKQMVSDWGGKMYFVYLPDWSRYSIDEYVKHGLIYNIEHSYREFVISTANELDIPVIDIHREVFATHKDSLSLFPFRKPRYYTADGYRIMAKVIAKQLEKDGYVPIKSK